MSVYNKEELLKMLEGIQEDVEGLDFLLRNRNEKVKQDIIRHERTLDHLEKELTALESRCFNTQEEKEYVTTILKRPVSLKLELGS
ncbi:hypothetical protein CEQ21_20240 [Niallia circulans]|uniref:Uncharacterized protein n=1 Tax=Niallia circulans TaxID=1397 RepID=A0A553SLC1_NIACI|nr:hypothetical protein [Niallia circulans]TRZ37767.1 hypothetical protein CEQ21_20240 [Niallia circulans]